LKYVLKTSRTRLASKDDLLVNEEVNEFMLFFGKVRVSFELSPGYGIFDCRRGIPR
jgi:hypothetical protein